MNTLFLMLYLQTRSNMQNPERLRPHIDSFIDSTFNTDACLLHTPSQIGLAAVLHAASREQENLDSYVTDLLFVSARDKLPGLIDAVRSKFELKKGIISDQFYSKEIRIMVKQYQQPDRDQVKAIEKKLDKCRNQANNPDSEL